MLSENEYDVTTIISGAARGTDTLAEQYAAENNIVTQIFPAEWKQLGVRAGFIRNRDIIHNCDVCIAFWDGESHGTAHAISLCAEMHKPVYIYNFITKTMTVNRNFAPNVLI